MREVQTSYDIKASLKRDLENKYIYIYNSVFRLRLLFFFFSVPLLDEILAGSCRYSAGFEKPEAYGCVSRTGSGSNCAAVTGTVRCTTVGTGAGAGTGTLRGMEAKLASEGVALTLRT